MNSKQHRASIIPIPEQAANVKYSHLGIVVSSRRTYVESRGTLSPESQSH